MQALGEQVAAGVLGVDEVEVGHVVDDAAVGLLGDVLVEAAVAGLHVVDGDPHPLGHHGGDASCWCRRASARRRVAPQQHLLAA